MMMSNKKSLLLATAMLVALPVTIGLATTTNQNATALFRPVITLSNTAMAFSKVDYSAAPSVAGDFVKLGTNNATLFGGVFSASGGAAPAAGTVTVTAGLVGQTVEVRCDITAIMAEAGGATIGIKGIEVTTGAGGAYGTASACLGVGGAAATTKVLAGADVFKFGGWIDGAAVTGAWAAGAYSTATAGGNDIQVDVTYI